MWTVHANHPRCVTRKLNCLGCVTRATTVDRIRDYLFKETWHKGPAHWEITQGSLRKVAALGKEKQSKGLARRNS